MGLLDKAKEAFNNGFAFMTQTAQDTELGVSFALPLLNESFVKWFVIDLYKHVLTDCRNKAVGIKEKDDGMFWDSFVMTEQGKGLITLLAEAMYAKSKIYLVYKKEIVSEANAAEKAEIDRKIKDKKELKKEALCDFTDFTKTDLLKICAGMFYNAIGATNTGMNITQALQVKISELRKSIADSDSKQSIGQAKTIAKGLKAGKAVLLDGNDQIVVPSFDTSTTEGSINLINGLAANFMGRFPLSYVNGALATGISTTGESDELAVGRALKFYFNSIFRPVVRGLTGYDIKFKEESWRKLAAVGNLIAVIEQSDLIPQEYKDSFVREAFE
jgi:hypothetical protein